MPESRIDIIAVESGFDKLNAATSTILKMADAYDELVDKTDDVQDSQDKAVKEFGALEPVLKKTNKEVGNYVKQQNEANEALKNQARELTVYGVRLGDIENKLRSWVSTGRDAIKSVTGLSKATKDQATSLTGVAAGLGNSGKAVGILTKGFQLLRVAIIGTGIGALVIALVSLVAFFTKTQRGADLLAKGMAALGAITNVISDRFENLGGLIVDAFSNPKEAISDLADFIKEVLFDQTIGRVQSLGKVFELLFSGDFQGAAKEAADVITGVNNSVDKLAQATNSAIAATKEIAQEIQTEVAATLRLEAAKQRLRDQNIELIRITAEYRSEIKRLNKDAEDTTKTFDERKAAAEQAFELENALLAKRVALAKENVAVIKEENSLSNNLTEDNERLAQAQANLANIRTESLELQTTLQNKLNTITEQQRLELEKLRGVYDELIGSLAGFVEIEQTPFEQFTARQEAALSGLEDQFSTFKELVVKLGISPEEEAQITKTYEDLFQSIREQVFITELPEIGKLDTPELELDEPVKVPLTLELAEGEPIDIESITGELSEAFQNLGEDIIGPFAAIDEVLGGILEEDYFGAFQAAAGAAFGSIIANAEKEIAALEEVINQRQKLVDETEAQIAEELANQSDGYANRVEMLQGNLEVEKRELEAAEKEKAEIQRKAQIAQILNDTIAQSSNLITAATAIFRATAVLGPAGPIVGGIAVAGMLAAFAKFKVDALKATRLHTGTDGNAISDYFAPRGALPRGKSDKNGGKGYRLTDEATGEKTNVIISGRESLLDEDTTGVFAPFLEAYRKDGTLPSFDSAAPKTIREMQLVPAPVFESFVPSTSLNNTIIVDQSISSAQMKELMREVFAENFIKEKMEADKRPGAAAFVPDGAKGKVVVIGKGGTRNLVVE